MLDSSETKPNSRSYIFSGIQPLDFIVSFSFDLFLFVRGGGISWQCCRLSPPLLDSDCYTFRSVRSNDSTQRPPIAGIEIISTFQSRLTLP